MKRNQLTRSQFIRLIDALREGPHSFTDWQSAATVFTSKVGFEVTANNLKRAAHDADIAVQIITKDGTLKNTGEGQKLRGRLADVEHRLTNIERQLGIEAPPLPPAPVPCAQQFPRMQR